MAMDELLLQYKLENSKKNVEKKNSTYSEEDLDLKRPALSDLLKEEESPIAIVNSNAKQQMKSD
jgi:hypothetical protein